MAVMNDNSIDWFIILRWNFVLVFQLALGSNGKTKDQILDIFG